jgi:hypothetical protein
MTLLGFGLGYNAEAQLPPEQPKAAEGTPSAAALGAVNCSDLLGEHIHTVLSIPRKKRLQNSLVISGQSGDKAEAEELQQIIGNRTFWRYGVKQ